MLPPKDLQINITYHRCNQPITMSQDPAATNLATGPVAPGELCWLEVPCVDAERAFSFYQAVFGWAKPYNVDGPIPGYGEGIESIHTFTHGKLYGAFVKMSNADNVAVTVDQELPFKMPVTPYLLVADIDKTAEVVAASGGKVHVYVVVSLLGVLFRMD